MKNNSVKKFIFGMINGLEHGAVIGLVVCFIANVSKQELPSNSLNLIILISGLIVGLIPSFNEFMQHRIKIEKATYRKV